jgi:pyruvate/2-oxoglutarate dehydrogenase complex dihydrolipoamide dehydrogenase (E3) component
LRGRGVELIRERAKFVAPDAVEAAGRRIEAKHIATVSKPRPLPIPGAELRITSDEVLSERERPQCVVFVGGGVIPGNVAHEGFKLAVDDYLRSKTNPSVYVCGDVTASPQLSPVASYEGRLVGRNISRAPSTSPIMRRCHRRSTPCRRSPPSACPRLKPRSRG